MSEKDIRHQNGDFWVVFKRGIFTVFKPMGCGSVTDSAYNDLTLAVARCDYLAKRAATETRTS